MKKNTSSRADGWSFPGGMCSQKLTLGEVLNVVRDISRKKSWETKMQRN